MNEGEDLAAAAAVQLEILSKDLQLPVDRRVCGDIKIVDLGSQHKIAHGAAHDIRLVSVVDQLLPCFKRIRADAVSSEMVKLLRYDQLRPAVLLNQSIVIVDHAVDLCIVKEGFRFGKSESAEQYDGCQQKQTLSHHGQNLTFSFLFRGAL